MTEPDADDASPQMTPEQAASHWQVQLHLAEREVKDWWDTGDKVQKRYRLDKEASLKGRKAKRFAILFSNTETLKSALYARTPKPDVRRRFGDRNPVARTAAEIIERTLSYAADNTTHDRAYRAGVHDLTLPGRGVVRLCYEAETSQAPQIDPMTQQPMTGEDGTPVMVDQITDQEVSEEHVYWRDFLWSPCQSWRECTWVAFRKRMSRQDLRDNGFSNVEDIPLNWSPDMGDKSDREIPEEIKRAEVWEIWCKTSQRRYWIVKGHKRALRIDDDPYELEGFFPLAEPLSAVLGTDTYVPAPFFSEYEDQADDLDEITARISVLIKALKRRGVYDASVPELKRLAKAADNEFIGVDGAKYNLVQQAGGLKKAFDVEDIKPTADILLGLYQQRDQLIQSIYEVSGISDIVRGSTNPNETATAQNIKAQFGSMRLRDSQREVQRWVRDSYRIKAELICTNFTPERLAEICGMDVNDPVFQQAVAVLKSDERRGYQIDIETDSTVFEDAEAEKNARVELLTAMGGFAQQWLPLVQAAPPMLKLVGEMMAFGVRGFKAGRSMEDTIDEAMQAMQQQMAQAAAQPPQPDPALEAAKEKAMLEIEGKRAELDFKRQSMAMEMEHKQRSQSMDMAARSKEIGMEPGPDGTFEVKDPYKDALSQVLAQISSAVQQTANVAAQNAVALQQSAAQAARPKRVRIVRGPDGKAIGAETV